VEGHTESAIALCPGRRVLVAWWKYYVMDPKIQVLQPAAMSSRKAKAHVKVVTLDFHRRVYLDHLTQPLINLVHYNFSFHIVDSADLVLSVHIDGTRLDIASYSARDCSVSSTSLLFRAHSTK